MSKTDLALKAFNVAPLGLDKGFLIIKNGETIIHIYKDTKDKKLNRKEVLTLIAEVAHSAVEACSMGTRAATFFVPSNSLKAVALAFTTTAAVAHVGKEIAIYKGYLLKAPSKKELKGADIAKLALSRSLEVGIILPGSQIKHMELVAGFSSPLIRIASTTITEKETIQKGATKIVDTGKKMVAGGKKALNWAKNNIFKRR